MSDDWRDELHASGVVVVRSILDEAEIRRLRETFEVLRASEVPPTRHVLYTHREPESPNRDFRELMEQWFNPHRREGGTHWMIDALRLRLASFGALIPFQDVLMAKQLGHHPFPWHQDEPFWPVDVTFGLVVWCALDAVDHSNGGLEFAHQSHHAGRGPSIDLHTGDAQRDSTGALVDLSRFDRYIPTLAPGDAVMFHPRMWHRSGQNRSGAPRRAWSSSWLAPTARWNLTRAPRHPLAKTMNDGEFISESDIMRGSRCGV